MFKVQLNNLSPVAFKPLKTMKVLTYARLLGFFPFVFDIHKKCLEFSQVGFCTSIIKSALLGAITVYLMNSPTKSFLTSALRGSLVMANSVRFLTRLAWLTLDVGGPVLYLINKTRFQRMFRQFFEICRDITDLRYQFLGLFIFYGPLWLWYYCFCILHIKPLTSNAIITYFGLNGHGLYSSVDVLIFTCFLLSVKDRLKFLQFELIVLRLNHRRLKVLMDELEKIQLWLPLLTEAFGMHLCFSVLSNKITQIGYFYLLYEGVVASDLELDILLMYDLYLVMSQVVSIGFINFFYFQFNQVVEMVSY